ncbi:MAG: hypothetical protein ACR2J5_11080 [Geodermatophilaceae bacterium]
MSPDSRILRDHRHDRFRVALFLIVGFRLVWRVAEPNEALIISGLGAHGANDTSLDSLGFKIVVGAELPSTRDSRRSGDSAWTSGQPGSSSMR